MSEHFLPIRNMTEKLLYPDSDRVKPNVWKKHTRNYYNDVRFKEKWKKSDV